ncbi:hypothetical protein GGTG_12640 [Gaeumannomyces tritici R3-111a-1]|uniref:Uncharacterized protein n=1 Tax=Gaeumannomyces tritici (strain R3-111a-1) TaxID=644352 RepID=J3PGL1_GAET3|nr:hypothetical protein GGTG_12640 [Gaeumannomyces tritici R3-111a-1]EJT69757.1 hypothetical protein GGTG_12640 [Gaeumannomyces tritici R3-111a-1]
MMAIPEGMSGEKRHEEVSRVEQCPPLIQLESAKLALLESRVAPDLLQETQLPKAELILNSTTLALAGEGAPGEWASMKVFSAALLYPAASLATQHPSCLSRCKPPLEKIYAYFA